MAKIKETVWDRVLEAMLRSGYKERGIQARIADLVGVKQPSVAKWKDGGNIATENLITLSDKLGVSLDWLLTGKGPMRRPKQGEAPKIDGEALSQAVAMLDMLCADHGRSPPTEKRVELVRQFYELALTGDLTRAEAERRFALAL